ncbi:MAG: site-specific DNA-methyltransferase [Candidatus Cloacimonetes bacterium]|nr:site-specific DNA-methyltransferase [Candidatus Cloacimonadota bacterium]
MPTLDWIGKDKVINHHLDVPYRVLEKKYTFGADNESENKIIKGDNLEALKSLLPEYAGRIDCIYIDPPYNTGNEKWVYNDNVNDPKLKKWLGQVVGQEGEDLSRHDKWLCMMYPRLRLLHKLLSENGAIFISIDDNEQANLKLVCNEIFGTRNFIAQFVWKKKQGGGNDSNFVVIEHEYVFCYAKNIKQFNMGLDKIYQLDNKLYPFRDTKGEYGLVTLDKTSIQFSQSLVYEIIGPDGITYYPRIVKGKQACWRWSKTKVNNQYDELVFKNGKVYTKYYRPEGVTPKSLLIDSIYGRTESGNDDIKAIFKNKPFDYPKPVMLLSHIISIATNNNSTILDSFAGSGTTAHAVLNLNKEDGGNRKFILIEMMDYAETITAERVKRVINGYSDVEGTGGDFSFYEIGEPLLINNEYLNENLDKSIIRDYIFFMETKQKIEENDTSDNEYYLGYKNDVGYYFYYDKNNITNLDYKFLSVIKQKYNNYIIYADKCTLSNNELIKFNITFKKIPRDITRL